MDKTWNGYKNTLLTTVGVDLWHRRNYKSLFDHLHNREFIWLIDRDENRADDGLTLRRRLRYDFGNRPCSVLEMLVALSIRGDDEIFGDPADPRPGDFFWEMIENLALENMTEKKFNPERIDRILDRWMNREFFPDGRGSIFRVKFNIQDMRDLEIWDQMNCYVSERYG